MTHFLKKKKTRTSFLSFNAEEKKHKDMCQLEILSGLIIISYVIYFGVMSKCSFFFRLFSPPQKHLELKWSRELVFIPLQTNLFSTRLFVYST
jgi:hypothetical protein